LIELRTVGLCKIKTGAHPIPTILKLDFPFFLWIFDFYQKRSSCFGRRQPPISASRRQAADNNGIDIHNVAPDWEVMYMGFHSGKESQSLTGKREN
jgi:hypothetical protein